MPLFIKVLGVHKISVCIQDNEYLPVSRTVYVTLKIDDTGQNSLWVNGRKLLKYEYAFELGAYYITLKEQV